LVTAKPGPLPGAERMTSRGGGALPYLACGASHKAKCGGRLQDDVTQFEDFVIRDLVLARLV
jgi:hypothetical protein